MTKPLTLGEIKRREAEEASAEEARKARKASERAAARLAVKQGFEKPAAGHPESPEPTAKPRKPRVLPPKSGSTSVVAKLDDSVPRGKDQESINEAYQLPYDPPSYHFAPSADPMVELASRELCRRKLLPFIQRFRPKYTAGWVHEDICRRIERFVRQVEAGESPRLLLMMPPRSGKLLADDTLVPTPNGWKLHGELTVGDEVFHPSGRAVKVLALSQKDVADVKVTFSDGAVYHCHENHEWTLYDRKRGQWKTLEAGHFLRPSHLGTPPNTLNNGRSIYQLPVVQCLDYGDNTFALHPYALGAWLGDGSAGKACITGAKSDHAITAKINALGYKTSAVCEHKTTGVLTTYFSGPKPNNAGRMTLELQNLGIYANKRIPVEYQTLTKELRLELLAGLIDTDGTTDENSRISITTVSNELADDIKQLCEGLGFRPYVQEVQPTLSTSGIQGKRVCYVVGFQPTCDIPVALERKRVTRHASQRRVGLVSVERVQATRSGHCIQVDSPDGLYVVGTHMTATHNSEISSRHTPAWILGQHPEWEIIAGSHTSSLSLSFSRYLRDVMRDPAYTAVFPDARLDPSSQSVENWNLTKGGGYLAAGVGTGITGRGAHVLLLDDLVKDIEAADSITIRDNTWEWYLSTAYTRLAPGGGVLGLMTWWHGDDWAGRIQEAMNADDGADKFEIIRYPAINEYGDEYILPDESIQEIPEGEPVPPGSRLTRRKDTAIHPQRYTTEMMRRIKHNLVGGGQKRVWDALYQQNPIPDEGNYFSKEMFNYYGSAPTRSDLYVYQAWDFAISEGKESDYTVGMCIGVDHRDNVYVLDVRRFRSGDSFLIVDTILDFARDYDADALGFEDGQIWKAIESQFKKRCEERRHFPSYEVLKPLTDKMVRANPLRGRMQLNKVFFDKNARWFTELFKEMLHFPAGKHDDQCFVAGTQITMGDGSVKAIEHVLVGDSVLTPEGPRRVLASQLTNSKAVVYDLDGLITGTGDHPVFTENRGFVPLANLTTSDTLQFRASQDKKESPCHGFTRKQQQTSTRLSSTASYIAAIQTQTASIYNAITRALVGEGSYTETFGNFITDQFRQACRFITSTGIISTTTSPIWSASPESNMTQPTRKNDLITGVLQNSKNTLRRFAEKLPSGTAHLKASLGMRNTLKTPGSTALNTYSYASTAGVSSSQSFRTPSSAQNLAVTSTGTNAIRITTLPRMLAAEQPVYNLTVDDTHTYYANGVLVHNCDALAWAIRLTLSRLAPKQKDYTKKLPSWKDKLPGFLEGLGASHMSC